MSTDNPANDLGRALAEHAPALEGAREPTREDATALLLPLGRLVLEGDYQSAGPTLEHVGSLLQRQEGAWSSVIGMLLQDRANAYCERVEALETPSAIDELAILEALREELECLIQACLALNAPPEEALEARVRALDATLEAHLDAD